MLKKNLEKNLTKVSKLKKIFKLEKKMKKFLENFLN